MSRSLFIRSVIVSIILYTVLFVALFAVLYSSSVQFIDNQASEFNGLYLQSLQTRYDNFFDELQRQIVYIVADTKVQEVMRIEGVPDFTHIDGNLLPDIKQFLNTIKLNNADILDITLVMRNSNIVLSTLGYFSRDLYFNINEYYIDGRHWTFEDIDWDNREGTFLPSVTHYKFGERAGEFLMYLKPLPYKYSNGRCCLLVHLNPGISTDIYAKKTLTAVLDQNGKLLFKSVNANDISIPPLSLTGSIGQGRLHIDGHEYVYDYIASEYSGFYYLSMTDVENSISSIQQFGEMFIIVVLIGLFFCWLISYVAARFSTNPLSKLLRLIHNSTDISSQDLTSYKNEYQYIEGVFHKLTQENKTIHEQIQIHLHVLRNNTLLQLLQGRISDVSFDEELARVGISFPKQYCLSAVIKMDTMNKFSSEHAINNLAISTLITSYIERWFKGNNVTCYAIEPEMYRFALVLNLEHIEFQRETLMTLVSDLKLVLQDQFETVITMGVGTTVGHHKDLAQSYLQANMALDTISFNERDDVILYEDVYNINKERFFSLVPAHQTQIINALMSGDLESLSAALDMLLLKEGEPAYFNRGDILNTIFFLISPAVYCLYIKGVEDRELIQMDEVIHLKTMKEVYGLILSVYAGCIRQLKQADTLKEATVMDNLCSYIQEHYMCASLSLTQVASHFSLSANNVSRRIKETTGKNFVDYVSWLRMEKATELLRNRAMPIKDVSVAVGYDNDINFRRVFKKYFSITPGQYRDAYIQER